MLAISLLAHNLEGAGYQYAGAIPAGVRGKWCAIVTRTSPDEIALLRVSSDPDAHYRPIEKYLRALPFGRLSYSLLHIPGDARTIDITSFGGRSALTALDVKVAVVGPAMAALLLMVGRPMRLLRAIPGKVEGLPARARKALAQIAVEASPPVSYEAWIKFFDTWSPERLSALSPERKISQQLRFAALVVHNEQTPPDALRATVASLENSSRPIDIRLLDAGRELPLPGVWGSSYDYMAVLQAGEVVPVHGFALADRFITALREPSILLADEDNLDDAGQRGRPLFKPQPSRLLMLSGVLSRGLWLLRRDVMDEFCPASASWAETLRLEIWLRLHERGRAGALSRIPHILAHRRSDTQAAPPGEIGRIVREHLSRSGLSAQVMSDRFPIDVQFSANARPRVSLIVPTTARKAETIRCISGLLANTDWPDFEIIIVVSQQAELDRAQSARSGAGSAGSQGAAGAVQGQPIQLLSGQQLRRRADRCAVHLFRER